MVNEFKKLAEELRGIFTFTIADSYKDEDNLYQKLRQYMGISNIK